jgi:hypothetical protein
VAVLEHCLVAGAGGVCRPHHQGALAQTLLVVPYAVPLRWRACWVFMFSPRWAWRMHLGQMGISWNHLLDGIFAIAS